MDYTNRNCLNHRLSEHVAWLQPTRYPNRSCSISRVQRTQWLCRDVKPQDLLTSLKYILRMGDDADDGMVHDEIVRDRIVVGIRDSSLSEKLQLDAELTLTTAIAKVHQVEEVKKQQPLLRGEARGTNSAGRRKPDIPVGAVQRRRRPPKLSKPRQVRNSQPQTCTRCGKCPSHDRPSCPAKGAICHKCTKHGHFQAVCRSTPKVREINQGDPFLPFLGGVDSQDTANNPWRLSLLLNDTPTEFNIDTGVEVSVISF